MMPPPIEVEYLPPIDWVLCTHRHGDHLDPGTLPPLARLQPECRFVVPEAELAAARAIGLPEDQLVGMDAGQQIELGEDLCLDAIPSAHERSSRTSGGGIIFWVSF